MTSKESTTTHSDLKAEYNRFRSLLLPYAYNILGDMMEAQDIVQNLLNHYFIRHDKLIDNPTGYLVRAVINRAINEKKLLRRRMENYPGKWLPTPVLTEDTIYANADREKILQYSLLVLLEQLGAKERAVFILKETFDVPHEEIAETLNIDIAHSRQLLKRGKEKINTKIRQKRNALEEKELLSQLTDAITTADVEATKRLLAEDVLSISDGGPNTRAARKVLAGIDRVSKFLKAIYGKYYPEGATANFAIVNHNPALIFKQANEVFRCMVFDIHDGQIQKIFIVVNPDKLVAMQPLNEGV